MATTAIGKAVVDTAESENLSMRGNFKRENRETPGTFQGSFFDLWERSENVSDGTADMHVPGESDDFVVPTKWANKTGTPAAESMKGRRSPKSSHVRLAVTPDTVPDTVTFCEHTCTACSDVYIVTVLAQRRSRMR